MRIHVTGASGSGATTLGRAIAMRLGCLHLDGDDFFWVASAPPYRVVREIAERRAMLREAVADATTWTLSGSIGEWADSLIPMLDLVVYLEAPTAVRIERLRTREAITFGDLILPGGPRHQEYLDFLDWAAAYDSGTREGRSRARHEAWLAALPCRVIRLDGTMPTADLVERVIDSFKRE